MKADPSRLFMIVIDALDECDGDQEVETIIQLFFEVKKLSNIRLRIFITSRPETPIQLSFDDFSDRDHYQDLKLHDIPLPLVEHDISVFLSDEFGHIQRKHRMQKGWPEQRDIEHLCKKARGLFIYASTACRFVGELHADPQQRLSLILEDDYVGQNHTWGLDKIYTQILGNAATFGEDCNRKERERLEVEFRRIIGSVVVLSDPLSSDSLNQLLHMKGETVSRRLGCLYSVLDIPSQCLPIRLLHPSFRDFLLDSDRCENTKFFVNKKKIHEDLFVCSLELMKKGLKRDMCNLRLPGAFVEDIEGGVKKHIPSHLQYACRYWVHHLKESGVELSDNDRVHAFIESHFLHWLEALSLIGQMVNGTILVKTLESMLTPKSGTNGSLHDLVYDARRFILRNRSIIEKAPLQTYHSALLFSPKKSIIRCQFKDQIPP